MPVLPSSILALLRGRLPLAGALVLTLWMEPAGRLPGAEPSQSEVQAAYLYNFAKFVEWPASAFPTPASPVVIGLIDHDRLNQTVASVIGTNGINSHPVLIRTLNPMDPQTEGCHIIFIPSAKAEHAERILERTAHKPILTVSDTDRFATEGGMIGFIKVGASLKFEVNLGRASDAGLRISSKLLSLAKIVKSEPGKERK